MRGYPLKTARLRESEKEVIVEMELI